MSAAPIVVTGSHRSGTTWVGRMLCASGEAAYIHEPFNPRRRPGWSGNRIPYWYLHVTEANEAFYAPVVEDVLAFRYPVRANLPDVRSLRAAAVFAADVADSIRYRLTRPRPLIKDPFALFAAEWLAARFGFAVVVTLRAPLAFTASVKRLGWDFRFRSWLAQPSLADGLLAGYRAQMRALWAGEGDIVDRAIVMYNALHEVIAGYRKRHPEWIFVRHEDLAGSPEPGFAELYDRLRLRFDERARAAVGAHSEPGVRRLIPALRHRSVRRDSRSATSAWESVLSSEEIARVRAGTATVARLFYPEAG